MPDHVCFPLLQLASLLRGCNVICSLCKPVCHHVSHWFSETICRLYSRCTFCSYVSVLAIRLYVLHLWILIRGFKGCTWCYVSLKKKKKKIFHDTWRDMTRFGPKQRCEQLDWGLQHKMQRTNMAAIRCVIHPLRQQESLSREKQELGTWVWESRLWNGFNILPLPPSLFLPSLSTPFVENIQIKQLIAL